MFDDGMAKCGGAGEGGADGRLRLAAVVATRNRLGALRQTVAALLRQSFNRVVVVDNASTDGTAAWLARLTDPRILVLHLPENRGGAGGFEAGLRAALADGADWAALMDDDARPLPGAADGFRRLAASLDPGDRTGIVAAAVTTPAGQVCEMNRPAWNPFWHPRLLARLALRRGAREAFHLPDRAYAADAAPVGVDTASFVGCFVRRSVVDRIGLPDGGMFLYGDDVSFSLRARRAGFRILFAPALRFEHACRSLDGAGALRPMWKVYYLCRNNVSTTLLAAGPLLFPLALGWYLVSWRRKARRYAPSERAAYAGLVAEGIRDGLARRRGRNDRLHGLALARRTALPARRLNNDPATR